MTQTRHGANWMLMLSVFLVMLGITLVAPILPLYAREFGVSRTGAGALISVFAGARLGFDLVGGLITDRIGSRRVMVAGGLLLAGSSVAAALAPDYAWLLVARFLEGAGSAAFATAAMQFLVVTTDQDRLGRAMAQYQTGLLGGIAVGPIVGGYAAEIGDFTTPFWIYAAIGLAVAAAAWWAVPDSAAGAGAGATYRNVSRVLVRRGFLPLLAVTFAMFIMRAGARFTLLPLYAGEELELSEGRIGQVLAVSAAVNLLVVNPGGWLVDRVGRRPVLVVGLLLTGVLTASYGWATGYGWLMLVSVAFGLTAALASIPPPTLAGDLAPAGMEGTSVGLYRAAGDVGFIVGPLLLGSLAEGGDFRLGFVFSGVILLGAAIITLRIPETKRTVK